MDIASFGIVSVVPITALCYLVGLIIKASGLDDKWIPIICGFTGILLGIVGIVIMPDFPATDYITAAAIGAVSGFAATGIDQVYKQITKE